MNKFLTLLYAASFLVWLGGDAIMKSIGHIPLAPLSTLEKCQGKVVLKEVDAKTDSLSVFLGGACLVRSDVIVSAAHIFTNDGTRVPPANADITFFSHSEKISARVVAYSDAFDLALLKLSKVPKSMHPIAFADTTDVRSLVRADEKVYAMMLGTFDSGAGLNLPFRFNLPFSSEIIDANLTSNPAPDGTFPAFAYLKGDTRFGFSGFALVNGSGELLGVVLGALNGFTVVSLTQNIVTMLSWYDSQIPKNQ